MLAKRARPPEVNRRMTKAEFYSVGSSGQRLWGFCTFYEHFPGEGPGSNRQGNSNNLYRHLPLLRPLFPRLRRFQ